VPKATAAHKPRKVGRNIVRAWLDTVLNPLLRGLDAERNLLVRENWTWRFEQQVLLSLVPVRSFVSFEALDNLEQFLALGPGASRTLGGIMNQHDERLRLLTKACQQLHSGLRESKELQNLYQRMKVEGRVPLQVGQNFDSLFGAYRSENHLDILAEDIVNSTGQLPNYFSTAPLWNLYRSELLKIRNVAGVRSRWMDVQRAGRMLESSVQELIDLLRRVRQDLSVKHDLPLVEARLA